MPSFFQLGDPCHRTHLNTSIACIKSHTYRKSVQLWESLCSQYEWVTPQQPLWHMSTDSRVHSDCTSISGKKRIDILSSAWYWELSSLLVSEDNSYRELFLSLIFVLYRGDSVCHLGVRLLLNTCTWMHDTKFVGFPVWPLLLADAELITLNNHVQIGRAHVWTPVTL